ncbi:MAG: ATPase [Fermentimonas sp.]
MKRLIADSGATKTSWALLQGSEVGHSFTTKGISPIFQSAGDIEAEIATNVGPLLNSEGVEEIYFYGSGCTPENTHILENALRKSSNATPIIVVQSDLMAAVHSLCGNSPGVACILGTGSNSCHWDGTAIVEHVSPLGFILGDEGSGAHLGKQLLSSALKNQLTKGIKEKLLQEYSLTEADIIKRVYRQPYPSRFLASFSPFIKNNIGDESIMNIVSSSFDLFIRRNILQYDAAELPVSFVGSVAWHYSDILEDVVKSHNLRMGKVLKSPIEGLIDYYKQ